MLPEEHPRDSQDRSALATRSFVLQGLAGRITFVQVAVLHGTPPFGQVLDGTENLKEAQFGSRAISAYGAPGFACRI